MKKRLLIAISVLLLAGLGWGIFYLNSLMPVITGYAAKDMCSAVFLSHREPKEVAEVDLNFSLVRFVTNEINYQEQSVTSRFLWGWSKAIFRVGFGCTLIHGKDGDTLRKRRFPPVKISKFSQDYIAWPYGNMVPDSNTGINKTKLAGISDGLVTGKAYGGDVFAFVVLHRGFPVAEKYKAGFTAKTRFLGWSMAKSFTNAMTGIMVGDSMLNINEPAGITAWKNDDRSKITINNLLQMQSGLKWNEDYGTRSDVTTMLYNSTDFAAYATNKPAEFPAGSHWYYSSGSTNIVSFLLRKRFNDDNAYYAYMYNRLLAKTGMSKAVLETDQSGTIAGSSYVYATARDYARFGLLYLQDGMFKGERILPEGWVSYTTTPASQSKGAYGSFFWLNRSKYYPSAPADMYSCNGHDGQRIFIIPSKSLVIVVLGRSPKPDHQVDFDRLLKDVIATVPEGEVSEAVK